MLVVSVGDTSSMTRQVWIRKTNAFYNAHRVHASLEGRTPVPTRKDVATLDHYCWDEHCRGLYQTPIAA